MLEHYDAYIVDSKGESWGASLGRESSEEAEKCAREHLSRRLGAELNYKPAKLVIFKCVSVSEVSL